MDFFGDYNKHINETKKRLKFMDGNDILSMDLRYIARLADFGSPELVRCIVAKGDSKLQKKQILEKLKEVYQCICWYEYVGLPEECGYTEEEPWYFNEIKYDIETNTPLLPDEESPLPASPEGEELAAQLESRAAHVKPIADEELRDKISVFFKDEETAGRFLTQLRAIDKDGDKMALVRKYKNAGLCLNTSKALWRALNDAQLYTKGYTNWNQQLIGR